MRRDAVTRQQALAQGLKRYFTGVPCKRGHVTERDVAQRRCLECEKVTQRYENCTPAQIEAKRGYGQKWYDANKDTDAHRTYSRASAMEAYARRIQRIPSWVDLKAITAFYAACPDGYEVDHIIPLNGKIVSGLHVLNNLQYLTFADNRAKSNKYEVNDAS